MVLKRPAPECTSCGGSDCSAGCITEFNLDIEHLKAAAIAVYPMYKGLARLVGMDIVDQALSHLEKPERNRLMSLWQGKTAA